MPPHSPNDPHSIHWLDVEEVAEALHEAYPSRDPMRLGFTELKKLVLALPTFREQPGHPCNERILEEVQAEWIALRAGTPRPDDD